MQGYRHFVAVEMTFVVGWILERGVEAAVE